MKIAVIRWPGVLLVLVFLGSCATTSREYVEEKLGYSSTKGRLIHLENLDSHDMEHLADGVAIHIDNGGCRVTVQFEDQVMGLDVGPGSILVFGREADFLLQPVVEATVETSERVPESEEAQDSSGDVIDSEIP